VSNHPAGPLDLGGQEADVFKLAMLALEKVLGMPVAGLLLSDDGRLCLIPRPGADVELLEVLSEGSWHEALRIAKEHRP
jgi:hypothetical protein